MLPKAKSLSAPPAIQNKMKGKGRRKPINTECPMSNTVAIEKIFNPNWKG